MTQTSPIEVDPAILCTHLAHNSAAPTYEITDRRIHTAGGLR